MPDTPKAPTPRPSRSRTRKAAEPGPEPAAVDEPAPEAENVEVIGAPADSMTAAPAPARVRRAVIPIPFGPAVRTGALGLSAVLFLYTALVLWTGIAYKDSAFRGNGADELHRIGLVGSQAIDLKFSIGVMLAALLIALAASLDTSDWIPFVAAILTALVAVFGFILAYLVYRYQVHNLTVQRPPRERTTAFDLGLYAYMVSTAGTCVVAFFVALPALIGGMRPRPLAVPATAEEAPADA